MILDNLSAHKTKDVEDMAHGASERPVPFHTDLRLVAQPSGAVVREDPARPADPRDLYLGGGSAEEAGVIHHPYDLWHELDACGARDAGVGVVV